ncbi:alcohol oxidase [Mycena alexandri]|uniref:Alcohol oxidase n=1 Tax=Mycena alexandri TaxID=1745969 RepID=A0AAD6T3E8_9AGAR|nr:alcohol oxidase [Mycena alexandri]
MWPFTSPFPAVHAREVPKNAVFDFIIVGGGTAGCCLASRLSEDPKVTVLLLERGRVVDDWQARVPLLASNPSRPGTPHVFLPSLPMKEGNGRATTAWLGEGLGGATLINSLLYTRGISDYNRWKEMGRTGWGYDTELESYFAKSENSLSQPASFRGKKGLWINQTFPEESVFEPYRRINEAASSLGIPYSSDMNSPDSPATCTALMDIAIDRNKHRHSVFKAFLDTANVRRRKNLTICVETIVTGIKCAPVEGSARPKAAGVYFGDAQTKKKSEKFFARATREVIICAGAISSPQILMLSGLGPKNHLESHAIPVVKDLPGVGSYLKDHLGVPLMFEVPIKDSLNVFRHGILPVLRHVLKYFIFGTGLLSVTSMRTTIFVRTALLDETMELPSMTPAEQDARNPQNAPDIEIQPIATHLSNNETSPMDDIGVFSMLVTFLRPKSFGSIRLTSADPHTRPAIDVGFLTQADDLPIVSKGVRLGLRLAQQMRARGYPMGDLSVPKAEDAASVDAFIRETMRTTYHYTSTCRMAPEDDAQPGVVDDELRVHGVDGLRVADCSIFPDIVSVHTMAPAVVVAEKCADFVKKAHGLMQ